MWIRMFALTLVLTGSFALAGCGGGNDSNKKGDDKSCGGEEVKPKTPAEHAEVIANKMKAAGEALDYDAVKALFHESEHNLVEQRIKPGIEGHVEDGDKVSVKVAKIEEADGKFKVYFENTITNGDVSEPDNRHLFVVEKDGKWWLSFGG